MREYDGPIDERMAAIDERFDRQFEEFRMFREEMRASFAELRAEIAAVRSDLSAFQRQVTLIHAALPSACSVSWVRGSPSRGLASRPSPGRPP